MISKNLIIRIETLPLEAKKIEYNTLLEITNKKLLQAQKGTLPFFIGLVEPIKKDIETLENLINNL